MEYKKIYETNSKNKGIFQIAEMYEPKTDSWILVNANDLDESYRNRIFRCPNMGCHKRCYLKIYANQANRFFAPGHINCNCAAKKRVVKDNITIDDGSEFSKEKMFASIALNGENANTKGNSPDESKHGDSDINVTHAPGVVKMEKRKFNKLSRIVKKEIEDLSDISDSSKMDGSTFLDNVITITKKNLIINNKPDCFEGFMALVKDTPKNSGLEMVNGKIWMKDYWSQREADKIHIQLSIPNNSSANYILVGEICGKKSNGDEVLFVFTRFKRIDIVDGILTYEAFIDDKGILSCFSKYSREELDEWFAKVDEQNSRV